MEWEAWRPTYETILADFGWDARADERSANALKDLVDPGAARDAWAAVDAALAGQRAIVVGAGPSLERWTRWPAAWGGLPVVCADGAATRLRGLGVVPAVVVTDLDGPEEDLEWAARAGAVMVVHAHGHNQGVLGAASRLGARVAPSCQCDPAGLQPLRNRGGFTDGDRAVLLGEAAGLRAATLVGFDLDGPPGRLGHRFDPAIKVRKLAWAKTIVRGAASRGLELVWAQPPRGDPEP